MAFDASMLAGANPYGAAIGAAAGVLNSALADTPTSVGGGAVNYQSGPFVVGSKQVGGKGNSAGATTASAQQTPAAEGQGNAVSGIGSEKKVYAIVAGVAAIVIAGLWFFMRRPKRK